MRLKLDENLSQHEAELLRSAGHDVSTVPEQGLCSSPDREVISVCRDEGRCLVTLDLDFANPLLFPPKNYPGLAVLRLRPRIQREDLANAIRTLVKGLETGSITGKLWIVQIGILREYRPESD